LAEILPIESANMYYKYVLPKSDRIIHTPEIGNPINSLKWYNEGYTLLMTKREPITLSEYCIPCWSLAALLDVLPDSIYDNTYEFSQLEFTKKSVAYMHGATDGIKIGALKDNLVDACYEMIIKLHEQKLL
jgi:hypothetical protein